MQDRPPAAISRTTLGTRKPARAAVAVAGLATAPSSTAAILPARRRPRPAAAQPWPAAPALLSRFLLRLALAPAAAAVADTDNSRGLVNSGDLPLSFAGRGDPPGGSRVAAAVAPTSI